MKSMQTMIIDRLNTNEMDERQSLIAGLRAPRATISPRYFYDDLGCSLYSAICKLPEYYPTRTEASIFAQHREAIANAVGTDKQLVDLGAGDCRKAAEWFSLLQPQRYLAVDTARMQLEESLGRLAEKFPAIEMAGIVMDLTSSIELKNDLGTHPATFFYPGSSIGNFAPDAALRLLSQIRTHCITPNSGLLIGVDTKKDIARLNAAYDDALGITAAFNLNVLNHINRLIGADFDISKFRHVGFYNEPAGRIEMHLEAITDCVVRIASQMRQFIEGDRIHTENSYKYARPEFESMLRRAGFGTIQCWQDDAQDFCVFYAT